MSDPPERIHVTADLNRFGVTIQIGEAAVAVAGPAPVGGTSLSEVQERQAALRLAARVREVARQEVTQEQA